MLKVPRPPRKKKTLRLLAFNGIMGRKLGLARECSKSKEADWVTNALYIPTFFLWNFR